MARIWREGQQRDVFIYRMITCGTIEEKIYQRQITKTSLSDQVIDTIPNFQQSNFTSDEMKALFQVNEDGFNCCQTHEIIACECDGSGKIPEFVQKHDTEEKSDEELEEEGSLRLFMFAKKKSEKKSALKQHELFKWEHHAHPVDETFLKVNNSIFQMTN